MTIGELVQIFQSFAGKTLYSEFDSLSTITPWVIYSNIVSTIFTLIIFFFTIAIGRVIICLFLNDDYKYHYIDENGKQTDKKKIKNSDLHKYKKIVAADLIFICFFFFSICCFFLSPILISRTKHHEVISFHQDHLTLKKSHIYIYSVFNQDKVYYHEIHNIRIYDYTFHSKRRYAYQCIFEFTMKDNKVVSFIIPNSNMRVFKMDSCFPPGTIFRKSYT